jgi:hypothetical protein
MSFWRGGPGHYDCVFINTDSTIEGMHSLNVACICLFFSLIHWFSHVGNRPDQDIGMWIVKPDLYLDGSPRAAVIHLNTILQGAYLIGVYGKGFLPKELFFTDSLNVFQAYYVNKYINHHSFETTFWNFVIFLVTYLIYNLAAYLIHSIPYNALFF